MRITAIVLGIIGALAIGGVGAHWVSDYSHHKATIEKLEKLGGDNARVQADLATLHSLRTAGTLGVLCSVVALAGVALTLKRKRAGVALLAAAAIVPGLWAAKMFVCGAPLALAAIFAYLATAKKTTAPPMQAPALRAA